MARDRLDVPRGRRALHRPSVDPEFVGRISERVARFLGTGRFLVFLTVLIVVWLAWNTTVPEWLRFDPYPFIFLTLILSIQASYAAPLILLAQYRQDDRDRVSLGQDRITAAQARADMAFLAREVAGLRHAVGEVATRDFLRSELRDLLDDLDRRAGGETGQAR